MYSDNSYQTKYETFCTTVDACKPTSRDLWIIVNELFQPKVQSSRKLSVYIKKSPAHFYIQYWIRSSGAEISD